MFPRGPPGARGAPGCPGKHCRRGPALKGMLLDPSPLQLPCWGRLLTDLGHTRLLGHPSWPELDRGHHTQRFSRELSSPAGPLKLRILQLEPANLLPSMGSSFHAGSVLYSYSQKPCRGRSGITLLLLHTDEEGKRGDSPQLQRINDLRAKT